MTEKNIDLYRQQFYLEAEELLEKIYDDLIRAEAEPTNSDVLNSLFRGIHTIKGSAGSFELEDISYVAHHLEGILNRLRSESMALTSDGVDVLLAGTDHMAELIRASAAVQPIQVNQELVAQLTAYRESLGKPIDSPPQESTPSELSSDAAADDEGYRKLPRDIQEQLRNAETSGLNLFRITLHYTSEHLENGYDPMAFLKNLRQACTVYYAQVPSGTDGAPVPSLLDFEPLSLYLKPVLYIATNLSSTDLYELTFDPSLIAVQPISGAQIESGPSMVSDFVDSQAISEFIIGTTEMLEAAETAVIEYEKTGSAPALNEIFRVVHNIKGDADFIGLKHLTEFSHALESLLEQVRSGSVVESNVADIILHSIDYFRQTLNRLSQGVHTDEFPPIYETIKNLIAPQPRTISDQLSGFDSETKRVLTEQLIQYKIVIQSAMERAPIEPNQQKIVLRLVKGIRNAAAYVGLSELEALSSQAMECLKGHHPAEITKAVGKLIEYIEALSIEPKRIGEILIQEGKITEEELAAGLAKQKPIGEILVDDGKITQEDIAQALKKQEMMNAGKWTPVVSSSPDQELRTLRVDEQKIDHLTNIVGELLIARNNYDYLLNQIAITQSVNRETFKAFKENLHLFSRLSGDLHYGVMSLRMVPVGGIFRRFTRIVRDISRRQKKHIELIIEGEDIEIDKKAADALTDPLVHLIRNACDHGIEPAAERIKSGKPEKGTLILKAVQEGSNLCIRVIDDGRGIDRQKIFEKAQKMGIRIASPDDPSVLDYIFVPGLTTLTDATEMSGRGVGMDVVKATVQSLGGTVQVASHEGKGTTIHLIIPMSMGIDEVLLVETGQRLFALPLSSILETLKIPWSKIRRAVHRLVIYYRGEVIHLMTLQSLLDGQSLDRASQETIGDRNKSEVSVIVIRTLKGKIGVIVDRFNKNMELSVKPLPKQLAGIDMFSGVSIMGDGRIVLVINPGKLAL